jgi:hypothetical protein
VQQLRGYDAHQLRILEVLQREQQELLTEPSMAASMYNNTFALGLVCGVQGHLKHCQRNIRVSQPVVEIKAEPITAACKGASCVSAGSSHSPTPAMRAWHGGYIQSAPWLLQGHCQVEQPV